MWHMHEGWWFGGMHLFWWCFWVVFLVLFFWLLTPVSRKRARLYRALPLEILQRRYAAGEISAEEYEERKVLLNRDRPAIH